ncbi:MFS multidrug transporter-like protein [Lineolata rhizophorae]|uniref:MFS multidrug transporter-like protein n=1 Tax=Lineolata rhizophorae TaxID=578093 RepID=A0A6A6P4A0_9PEZI|nr:MFS multidrug transporter-like protein [Lineolata rhizophorae]
MLIRPKLSTMTASAEQAPFPTRQLFVLALCRISEPIAFMSIFPYIYFMVKHFDITKDEGLISMYAGMVTSAFAFAEFSTGVLWGRLSDRVGRKPILLTGLAGTGLSMIVFGFAPNFPVAVVARALGGLLNGNIGVLQTTVAEVVTVESHQPCAYSIMPFVWCLGSIIGSGLGGTLAEPVKNYPTIFQPGGVFEQYPFLLPNLVCTFVVICGLIIGFLFLEETHEDFKMRRDLGCETGRWLLVKLLRVRGDSPREKVGYFEETLNLIAEDDEQPPGYQSTESSPRLSCTTPRAQAASKKCPEKSHLTRQTSIWQAFTRQVALNIIAYGILAFHTISFEQLFPVMLSTPDSDVPPSLPFKFLGGFNFSAKTVGIILSAQGIVQMMVQIFVFPVVTRRFGSLATFRSVILLYPFLHFVTPYLSLLPSEIRMAGVYVIVAWKVTAQSLAFPSNNIMINNAAPSKKSLGLLNGVAASAASLSRAFGPTVSGAVQSVGVDLGCAGLAWWVCSLIAAVGAMESLWMRETKRQPTGVQFDDVDVETSLPERLCDSLDSPS